MTSVRTAENGASYLEFGDAEPFGHEVVEALECGRYDEVEKSPQVVMALRQTRGAIRRLTTDMTAEGCATRQHIQEQFREDFKDDSPDSLSKRYAPRVITRLNRASNNDLLEFCIWNVERYDAHQKALNAATSTLLDSTYQGAQRLAELNYINDDAFSVYTDTIEKIDGLTALDSFDAGGQYVHAVCGPDQAIALANLFLRPAAFSGISPNQRNATFHEVTHGAGQLARAGFFFPTNRVTCDRLREEPIVTHITAVATDEKALPEVLDPAKREGPSSYIHELQLLDKMCTYGRTPLEPSKLVTAFFNAESFTARLLRREINRRLDAAVQEFFPASRGGWTELSKRYEDSPPGARDNMLVRWLEQIENSATNMAAVEPLTFASTPLHKQAAVEKL